VSRLLQGGFRTITGLISKRHPEAYRVETPVATIGVRGTQYEVALAEGLDVGVLAGRVVVENPAGRIELGAEMPFRFARVSAPDRPPVGQLLPPPALRQPGVEGPPRDRVRPPRAARRVPAVAPLREGEPAPADGGLTGDSTQGFLVPPELQPGLFSLVAPPDGVSDLQVIDRRLTALEWERLWNERYFGLVLWPQPQGPRLVGGHAIQDIPGGRPVITSTGFPPFAPEFAGAPLTDVYRRGQAGLAVSNLITVDAGHRVHWGIWNGNPDPVLDLIDPLDPGRVRPIPDKVIWATVLPTPPEVLMFRGDQVTLNQVAGALGASSNGPIGIGDVTLTLDIDFASGQISNGRLNVLASPDLWQVDFDGKVKGSFAELNLLPSSRVNGNPVAGQVGGVFTGAQGQAVLQAFDLVDGTSPARWAQGMVLVK